MYFNMIKCRKYPCVFSLKQKSYCYALIFLQSFAFWFRKDIFSMHAITIRYVYAIQIERKGESLKSFSHFLWKNKIIYLQWLSV